jgi:hypothetical protein
MPNEHYFSYWYMISRKQVAIQDDDDGVKPKLDRVFRAPDKTKDL